MPSGAPPRDHQVAPLGMTDCRISLTRTPCHGQHALRDRWAGKFRKVSATHQPDFLTVSLTILANAPRFHRNLLAEALS